MGRCKEVWGRYGKVYGVSVGKSIGVWGKVRGDLGEEVWGRCGRLHGVSVESGGKCVGVWGR